MDTGSPLSSSSYSTFVTSDTNAQTRTSRPTGYRTRNTESLPTASVSASQTDTGSSPVKSKGGSQRFDIDWTERIGNTVPKFVGAQNLPNGQTAGTYGEDQATNDQAATEDKQNEASITGQGTDESKPVPVETDSQPTGKGIHNYVSDAAGEESGKENSDMPNEISNEAVSAEQSRVITNSVPSLPVVGDSSHEVYSSIPSTSINAEVAAGNMNGKADSKKDNKEESNFSRNYAQTVPAAAQRRGEAAKPSNATKNETTTASKIFDEGSNKNKSDGETIASPVLQTGQQGYDTTEQSVKDEEIKLSGSINGQQQETQAAGESYKEVREAAMSNAESNGSSLVSNGSISGNAAVPLSTMPIDTAMSQTIAARTGATQLPMMATAVPTSKVIAEMKTTDSGNTSNAEDVDSMTGSVILTEKVSYSDLQNDTDRKEDGKAALDLTLKGPSIYYAMNGMDLKNEQTLPVQESTVSAEENEMPSSNDALPLAAAPSSPGQISPGQIVPSQSPPGQSSQGQSSPSQSSPSQSSPGESSPGQSPHALSSQPAQTSEKSYISLYKNSESTSPVEESSIYEQGANVQNENTVQETAYMTRGGFDGADGYGSKSWRQSSPSLRVEIPVERAMQIETHDEENDDKNMTPESEDAAVGKAEQEQSSEEAKVRVIRTIPVTTLPPLTSPIDEQANETITAKPTAKSGTEGTSRFTERLTPTKSVTGDMMALNDKLGIEQVESGDFLGAPPDVTAQHVYTPKIPEQSSTNSSVNNTLHEIFQEIVGGEFHGNETDGANAKFDDSEVVEGSDAAKEKEDSIQNKNKKDEETTNKFAENVKGGEDAGNDGVSTVKDDDVTNELNNQKPEIANDQFKQLDDKASETIDQATRLIDQGATSFDQQGNSLNHDSLSLDQSLKSLDQDSMSSESEPVVSNQDSQTKVDSVDQGEQRGNQEFRSSDQATVDTSQNRFIDQSAQSVNQDESLNGMNYKEIRDSETRNQSRAITRNQLSLTSQNEVSDAASRRDEIEAENYREPNTDDGGDEFMLPEARSNAMDRGLEELLLHPGRMMSETAAEDVADEKENYVEANSMVTHDDLEK